MDSVSLKKQEADSPKSEQEASDQLVKLEVKTTKGSDQPGITHAQNSLHQACSRGEF